MLFLENHVRVCSWQVRLAALLTLLIARGDHNQLLVGLGLEFGLGLREILARIASSILTAKLGRFLFLPDQAKSLIFIVFLKNVIRNVFTVLVKANYFQAGFITSMIDAQVDIVCIVGELRPSQGFLLHEALVN